MEVRIWPRGPKEKGGYAMMPMRKNIPAGQDGWELTQCPACGCECWKLPLLSVMLQQGPLPYVRNAPCGKGWK